ncbi:MAG: hypothetical protein ABI267_03225 [Ginsengibacter sp.]
MKKQIAGLFLIFIPALLFVSCSSSKNATNLKPTNSHLAGTWTITNIEVNVPLDFKVTNVFDEAPSEDFKGSTWNLVRNGNGSFTLANGTKENIYWSIYGKGDNAEFQFKKLSGMKAKNVETGYRLKLGQISSTSFTAASIINEGTDSQGNITYTFTKK